MLFRKEGTSKKEPTFPLTKKEKKEYKKKINDIRVEGFENAINQYGDDIGGNLGKALEDNLPKILPVVLERSAKWWINPDANTKITKLIKDGKLTNEELHSFAKSLVNTLRPLAGGTFEKLICDSLNQTFEIKKSALCAETKGKHRQIIIEKLANIQHDTNDVKPDIDVVVYDTKSDKILAVISCKTTFRERLMQTISWKNYFLSSNDKDIKKIKVFVVTAWETLEDNTVRKRTSVLDGVYVTNKNVKVGGNIKKFDSIYEDIKKLVKM